MKEYVFESTIYSSEIGKGGAYVIFPYDLRAEWNKGRLKVQATFDGVDYQGSIVNMGLGIKKEIRKQIKKDIGDTVKVVVKPITE